MSRRLKVHLAVALGWAALAGALPGITGIDLGSIAGETLIAAFYVPSPRRPSVQ